MTTRQLCSLTAAVALAATALWSAPSAAQAPAATVFEGARIIVGNGTVIDNGSLVVTGDRLTQVGRAADVRVPAGATRVSLAGKTVMPAILDTHTHLSTTRAMLTDDLRRRGHHGVGAAMSLGQDAGEVLQMRGQPAAGAARYFSAGRGITAPEPGRSMAPYWVTTDAEARTAVREQAALKVDIIKIWVDDRAGMYKKLSPELYGAVIDEAHKNNLRVTAHVFALADAKGLLQAGLDAFAHIPVRDLDLDDAAMALFRSRPNVVVVPNLPARDSAAFALQARNLAKLSAAGVKIAVGTDGNTPDGPHQEMADMVAAGMTPAQVVVAATKNAAEFLRVTDAGTLENGKSADFIVLDADPLQDIANTKQISSVYLRGAAVDRSNYR